MTKKEFLRELEDKLLGLPKDDIDERIEFYNEMIDDRIEEGKSEEEALKEIGTPSDIADQILSDTSVVKLISKKIKKDRKYKAWEIILLVLGFPLWLPLIITFFALLLVFYILLWVLVIVTYSVEISLIASVIWGFAGAFAGITTSGFNYGFLGIGLLAIGLSILFFFVCKKATFITIALTKKILLRIKKAIIRGGKKDA